ncbi:hypothetical protein HQN86_00440 [Pedobacter panaciterrae]|uniref:hypothetical protein n=1 Tax=Pedobacter panaciterrae TaxID=363849 RepID=UPI00155DA647|nr:hypothetical protein [Pedobacter panaciterrae]NQX52070.1 hypothetical protein [Pedobacter panaciterrae]
MNKSITYGCCLLLAMITSCKDFIEPSLEKREVKLLAPADGAETNKYQVGFAWEPMEDALRYRLQIASPDFDRPVSIAFDTLISKGTRLELTLDPGNYQWRLRAENGSSASIYQRNSFILHPSSLDEQKVTLIGPASGYLSNQPQVLLNWNVLFSAEQYRLQIDTLNFTDETKLVYDNALSGNQFSFSFPKDQSYQWRVRAENRTQSSKWSEARIMNFDKTPPGKPEVIGPANGAILPLPVVLSWKPVSTARKYKLYMYRSDGSTLYNSSFPLTLNGTSYSFGLGQVQGEAIFWRVLAIDEVGNEGSLTDMRNFSLQ